MRTIVHNCFSKVELYAAGIECFASFLIANKNLIYIYTINCMVWRDAYTVNLLQFIVTLSVIHNHIQTSN